MNRAWIDHEGSMTISAASKVNGGESKSLWLFSKFCKVTDLQMVPSLRFGDVPRQEIAEWGLVEEKDSKKRQLMTKTALPTFRAFCEGNYPEKDRDFDHEVTKEGRTKRDLC